MGAGMGALIALWLLLATPLAVVFSEAAHLQLGFAYQRGEVVFYCARSVDTKEHTLVSDLTVPTVNEQPLGLICPGGADTIVRTARRDEPCRFSDVEQATFGRGAERLRVLFCGDRYAALKKVPRPPGDPAR